MMKTGEGEMNELVAHIKSYASLPAGVEVFQYEKDPKHDGDYIAINHLPFDTDRNELLTAVFNVNVHAKDNIKKQISAKRIKDLTERIAVLFDEPIMLDGCWFELRSISQPYKDDDSTHFVNLKFNVYFSNM